MFLEQFFCGMVVFAHVVFVQKPVGMPTMVVNSWNPTDILNRAGCPHVSLPNVLTLSTELAKVLHAIFAFITIASGSSTRRTNVSLTEAHTWVPTFRADARSVDVLGVTRADDGVDVPARPMVGCVCVRRQVDVAKSWRIDAIRPTDPSVRVGRYCECRRRDDANHVRKKTMDTTATVKA